MDGVKDKNYTAYWDRLQEICSEMHYQGLDPKQVRDYIADAVESWRVEQENLAVLHQKAETLQLDTVFNAEELHRAFVKTYRSTGEPIGGVQDKLEEAVNSFYYDVYALLTNAYVLPKAAKERE